MAGALLLVDVIKDFQHEDGDRLLASYTGRHPNLVRLLAEARSAGLPVVYANDRGDRDEDAAALVRRAVEKGKAGDLVAAVGPQDEPIVLKQGYSGFFETSLAAVLRGLDAEELVLAGTATEMCVFETAMDALRLGFGVTVRADACATVDEANERLALDYLERVRGVAVLGRSG